MKIHLWGKTSTYITLIVVCVGIILLEIAVLSILDKMDKGESINDNITEGVISFIAIPGILVGVIGAIICAVRKK